MADDTHLSFLAKEIFFETLKRIDAAAAVRQAVKAQQSAISICGNTLDAHSGLYVVAIGKAAYPMARAFDEIAGRFVRRGVVSGTRGAAVGNPNWLEFFGGHPLPNEESLNAAKACCEMLERANAEKAPVVFLVSGGGSAMMELPSDPDIGLPELRELNDVLVTSGASIAEINSVRRSVSAVKGSGLALKAANCEQVSLIISDTRAGDVTSVASGPSLLPDRGSPNAADVVKKYGLEKKLPERVVAAMRSAPQENVPPINGSVNVLLDNRAAIEHAAEIASGLGSVVVADELEHDEMIDEGVEALLDRCLRARAKVSENDVLCYISGGEFGCEVRGGGVGGRNCESVLRMALLAERSMELLAERKGVLREFAFLSAGTDGIDGSSPAAGGVIGDATMRTANENGLDAASYLNDSDSFTFLDKLGAAFRTGPTGTNVRDLRIFLMK